MEENNTQKQDDHVHINVLPLLLIGLIIFGLFRVDLKTFFNSPQLKKNIAYIENIFNGNFHKITTKANETFIKNSGGIMPSNFILPNLSVPNVGLPINTENNNSLNNIEEGGTQANETNSIFNENEY